MVADRLLHFGEDAALWPRPWAQYQAQDALIKTCEKADIELTLFTTRRLWPAVARASHAALLSQPPAGGLKGGLRDGARDDPLQIRPAEVTVSSLSLYTSAILETTCCRRRNRKTAGVILWMSFPSSPVKPTATTCAK